MAEEVKELRAWSPMKMLELCYTASDTVREMVRKREKAYKDAGAEIDDNMKELIKLQETLAQFTNETQHVWDEWVELLDRLSDIRPMLESAHDGDWSVRDVITQYDYIVNTWDRE